METQWSRHTTPNAQARHVCSPSRTGMVPHTWIHYTSLHTLTYFPFHRTWPICSQPTPRFTLSARGGSSCISTLSYTIADAQLSSHTWVSETVRQCGYGRFCVRVWRRHDVLHVKMGVPGGIGRGLGGDGCLAAVSGEVVREKYWAKVR
jgi:hypothetical protein